jgi:hypothetical protein
MSGYIGTQPVPQATQTRDAFTATNNQTSFPTSGYTPEFLDVFLNGVKLAAADYTATNGSDVVLAAGATTGDILEVVSYGTFEVLNPTFDGNVTFTGNASFGDNDKAIFGDGNDLQIYHDGTHSYVADAGGGSLVLSTNGSTVSINTDGPENMAIFRKDSSVDLFHNNSKKFETTATGINVTGTAVMDGLTVDGTTQVDNYGSTSGKGRIQFGNSGQKFIEGFDTGNAGSGSYLKFGSGSTTQMTLDNSGNLLVGTTDNNVTNNSGNNPGINIGVAGIKGYMSSARYQGPPLNLNRLDNDGDIMQFAKDGTTVGSIGTNGSTLYIGSTEGADAHLGFGNQIIRPVTSSGASRDNAIDLGYNGMRFRDLYLSGGIYLGGTGSANKLDDYEEGNHTVTMTPGTSGTVNMNGAANEMSYTKIGRLVTVTGDVRISSVSSPVGHTEMSLPFTVANTTDLAERGGLVMLVWSGNWNHVTATYSDNRNYMIVDITPAAGLEYRFSFSYITS